MGGGCILYVMNCCNATVVEDLSNVPHTEIVWCKLILSNMSILIGDCFHTTSAAVANEIALHNAIRKVCSMNGYVIICGDFNHSSIDWNTLHAVSESQEFLDLVLDYFLIQHIIEATRGENVLDIVSSSIEFMIENVNVCEPFSSSDHNIITFDLLYDSHITTWKEYCFKLQMR